MNWARAAAVILTALLTACGGSSQEEAGSAAEGPAAQAPQQTVFDDMVGAQDRARAVEDVAAERQRELQRTLEEAEGK